MKHPMTLLMHRRRELRLRSSRAALGVLAVTILSACSAPALRPPSPSVPLAATFSNGTTPSAAPALDDAWWGGFGDPTLTRLVSEALSANQDMAMALQRVAQARGGADAQGSRLWPTVGVQASASRSESGVPEPVKQGMPDTRALRAGIDVAWEIDLAGGGRAARDAAQADAQAAAAGVTGARLLVASEVGRQYFVLRSAEERLRIVQALAAAQQPAWKVACAKARPAPLTWTALAPRPMHWTPKCRHCGCWSVPRKRSWLSCSAATHRPRPSKPTRPSHGRRCGPLQRASPANCSGAVLISSPRRHASAPKLFAAQKPAPSGGPSCS
jgi:hypothetical protein